MTMTNKIPVDTRRIDDMKVSDEDYEAAEGAHAKMKGLVLDRPAARQRYERALAEISLHQATLARVRQARTLAQATVAELMGMNQSEVSKLERRSDMFLSTLRRFVQATGGDLHLVARYPEGSVELLVPDTAPPENAGARVVADS